MSFSLYPHFQKYFILKLPLLRMRCFSVVFRGGQSKFKLKTGQSQARSTSSGPDRENVAVMRVGQSPEGARGPCRTSAPTPQRRSDPVPVNGANWQLVDQG